MSNQFKTQRRVYFDTNVFVSCFRNQQHDVDAIKFLFGLRDTELYTSALSISQTISTLQGKRKSLEYRQQIIDFINRILRKVNVTSVAETDIKSALAMPNIDIEDNIQYNIGCKSYCNVFVTNNVSDFNYVDVRVFNPKKIRQITQKPFVIKKK